MTGSAGSPSQVVVSLCNNRMWRERPEERPLLVRVDVESGAAAGVYLRHPDLGFPRGATGVEPTSDALLMIAQGQPHKLVEIEGDRVSSVLDLPDLPAIHSIVHRGPVVYAAVTGQDRIVAIDRADGTVREVWSASPDRRDSVHVNALLLRSGRLLASAFGPKAGELWASATQGYVFDVVGGRRIMQPLFHPHSVTAAGDGLLVCESSRRRLVDSRGTAIETGRGYLRGLAVNDRYLVVGSSVGRRKSESTGREIGNAADPGEKIGTCGLTIFEWRDRTLPTARELRFVDLSAFGEEIYDVRFAVGR